jgi:hypothetical protein
MRMEFSNIFFSEIISHNLISSQVIFEYANTENKVKMITVLNELFFET